MNNPSNILRIGVLSTARIGLEKVIPAIQTSEHARVTAIASRDADRAGQAAKDLGLERWHDSYEALLDDPEIDAIYNPLPNHLHVPWTLKTLEAGKHVLCEKPMGLNVEEIDRVIEAARSRPGLHVREAFMYKYHPRWTRTCQLIREGKIGELRTIHSHFSYRNLDPENIRNRPGMGGGGVMDIGCYSISLSRLLFGGEPESTASIVDVDPEFGVDRFASVLLDFGSGTSLFTCGTQTIRSQFLRIWGETGSIGMSMPFNPPTDRSTRLMIEGPDGTEIETFEPCNQFALQADDFARVIFSDVNRTGLWLADTRANMKVIEDVLES